MKLLYRLSPLLLAALLIGCAQNPTHTASTGNTFAPAGVGLSVNMPGKVKLEVDKHNVHFYHTEVGDISYIASYADLGARKQLTPAQINRLLDTIERPAGHDGSKLLSEKTITIDGHPARDRRVQLKNGICMHFRVTIVGGRLLQAMVATDASHLDAPEATRFLDSFHVTRH